MTEIPQERPAPDSELARDTLKTGPRLGRLSPWLSRAPGLFLLAVIGLGAGAALLTGGIWTSPTKRVMDGGWQKAFEGNFDQLHPVRTPGIDTFGVLNYALFGEGRPGVLVGQGGWLYTTEEFQTASTDATQIMAKLQEIVRTRDALRASGAELVVLLIPAKSRIYPEHLGRYRWPAKKISVYATFRERLTEAGVIAPSLLPAMQAAKSRGEVFLHTDTHWTPLGARVGAEVVAQATRSLSRLRLPDARFTTDLDRATDYSGDLLRYVPLGGWQTRLGPRPDHFSEPKSSRQDSGGGGLLGDNPVAVTLIGTSYSANARWGFEGALKEALHTDVINAAQEGKGPMIPMREYMKSQARKTNPPKLVVWEIPERFLPLSEDN